MQNEAKDHEGPPEQTSKVFAMVNLPHTTIKSGRHSRPLAPPGSARRIAEVSVPPVAPPRPQHTLTPQSRPVRPQKPATAQLQVQNVMELVSLPKKATGPVTLTCPRPEPEREKNLYTEAPGHFLPQKSPVTHTVIVEPTKKGGGAVSETIFCQDCGKCKCEACCTPRKLPQKWLFGGTCLCSSQTLVDSLSCMCCVKGLLYHCTKDRDEEVDMKNPISCHGPDSGLKWAALGLMCPFLPCLLSYPLLRGCAKLSEIVYAKCTLSGCQCQTNQSFARIIDSPPEKRTLLIEPKLSSVS